MKSSQERKGRTSSARSHSSEPSWSSSLSTSCSHSRTNSPNSSLVQFSTSSSSAADVLGSDGFRDEDGIGDSDAAYRQAVR